MIVNPHPDFSASAPPESNQDEWPGGMQPLVAAWRCPASAEQCLLEVLQHKGKVGWDPMQSQRGERGKKRERGRKNHRHQVADVGAMRR